MKRFALKYLEEWKDRANRKPLVIRGARQVGKTYLVREFGRANFDNILEINFERHFQSASLFSSNDPHRIIQFMEIQFNEKVLPGKTLLFLDEIQESPEVLASLRFFYEELPELHVIAAGSLLEFVLGDHEFSMPVGRIEYLHLGPMSFEEFLLANEEKSLAGFLHNFDVDEKIPQSIHSNLMRLVRLFLVIGGMPGVISAYLEKNDLATCDMEQHSIIATFRDDFNKYRRRANPALLQMVFNAIPRMVGRKTKYVEIDRKTRAKELSRALELLELARVVYSITHSHCNGIPLGAEVNRKRFKTIFLDIGLMSSLCGLNLLAMENADDVILVNNGAICEQFVGQHLLYSLPFYQEPALYYWTREKSQSSAEVDYVISIDSEIIPVEVKAGSAGRLKSMHRFIEEKKRDYGIRLYSGFPSFQETLTKLPGSSRRPFHLLSIPFYLAGQTRRLMSRVMTSR